MYDQPDNFKFLQIKNLLLDLFDQYLNFMNQKYLKTPLLLSLSVILLSFVVWNVESHVVSAEKAKSVKEYEEIKQKALDAAEKTYSNAIVKAKQNYSKAQDTAKGDPEKLYQSTCKCKTNIR